jgi:hypothetical protein
MTGLLWAVLGTFGGLGMTVIGDIVSEESETALTICRTPFCD